MSESEYGEYIVGIIQTYEKIMKEIFSKGGEATTICSVTSNVNSLIDNYNQKIFRLNLPVKKIEKELIEVKNVLERLWEVKENVSNHNSYCYREGFGNKTAVKELEMAVKNIEQFIETINKLLYNTGILQNKVIETEECLLAYNLGKQNKEIEDIIKKAKEIYEMCDAFKTKTFESMNNGSLKTITEETKKIKEHYNELKQKNKR